MYTRWIGSGKGSWSRRKKVFFAYQIICWEIFLRHIIIVRSVYSQHDRPVPRCRWYSNSSRRESLFSAVDISVIEMMMGKIFILIYFHSVARFCSRRNRWKQIGTFILLFFQRKKLTFSVIYSLLSFSSSTRDGEENVNLNNRSVFTYLRQAILKTSSTMTRDLMVDKSKTRGEGKVNFEF